VVEELNKIRGITLSILEKMKDTAETRDLKEKLLKCNDAVELLEIVTQISYKALDAMNEHQYLTEDEVENLKDTCKNDKERSLVRDLTDTGLKLKEVLKKKAGGEVLR
jgi:integrase